MGGQVMTGPQNLTNLNPIEILLAIMKHKFTSIQDILGLRKPFRPFLGSCEVPNKSWD